MSDLWERLQKARSAPRVEPVSQITAEIEAPAGWTWVTSLVAKRTLSFDFDPMFSEAVALDADAWQGTLCLDVEATGLSGGAGTTAFLIGWAETAEQGVRVTQWFLRDHPGEPDLIAAIDAELRGAKQLVSFNGASYDLPLLRSRWALAGREFPAVPHRDDLHPARRLWKRLLESCRLSMLEEHVLGILRDGDIGGALVPELWFSYLRSGTPADFAAAMGGVLSHHAQDVYSLLCLDLLLAAVRRDPESARWQPAFGPFPSKTNHPLPAPAGLLHPYLGPSVPVDFWGLTEAMDEDPQERHLRDAWSDIGSETVGLAWAQRLKRRRDPQARVVWTELWGRRRSFPALQELLKWLEHREKTTEARTEALVLIEQAFAAPFLPKSWREDLERRYSRLKNQRSQL
jgi:uncharacterized protein YprB with RNaseH-like and TPR domain